MARKGKLPIKLPPGVEVKKEESTITVKGPKGVLKQEIHPLIDVTIDKDSAVVSVVKETNDSSAMHGLFRTLIFNMVEGVSTGFTVKLTMIGVGYRAQVKGDILDLTIGLSHPTELKIPEGIQVAVEKNTSITLTGYDKQLLGQFAATIRSKQPPEPYQGKGIRYENEYVRKKAGKSSGK